MSIDELSGILRDMGVAPPDIPRAGLYLAQIQATRTFLFDTLAADPIIGGEQYARFQTALRDPALLNQFCEIIDDFLAPGVSAALHDWAEQYSTYENCFDVKLFDPALETYQNNVLAFFNAYPATNRAVQNLTTNFQNNIREACQRIQQNWNDLDNTFTPPNKWMLRLRRIQSTGSDFHKGGKQVLILTFDVGVTLIPGLRNVDPFADVLKIVYKPSDVEADCLIAGSSAAVNAVHGGFQPASLFEIINGVIQQRQEQGQPGALQLQLLPTYKILPYNWGSHLVPDPAGNLPIRDSYGYIEFLEHKHEPGQNIFNYYPFGASDFKIFPNQDAVAISRQVYQQIGELLAVASSFSLVDMHIENLIISRYQACLIDLEVCLTKEIASVLNTSFFGGLGGITGLTVEGVDYAWVTGGQEGHLHLEKEYLEPYKQNRLWTLQPNLPVNPAASTPAHAILGGFRDGLGLIRDAVNAGAGNRFNPWFARLNDVVVRYLPYGTGDFKAVLNDIYSEDHAGVGNFFQTRTEQFLTTKYSEYQNHPSPQPDFVAVQAIHTAADYQNCDIPVFYHRIGTLKVMNSSGTTVTIPNDLAVLDQNPQLPAIHVNVQALLGRDTFFAQLPTQNTVQANQVDALGNPAVCEARFHDLGLTLLDGLHLHVVPALSDILH